MKAETNRKDVYRKALCLLIPAAGLAFLLWYIKNATCDVVYSDYIRLVNSYLPDVYDPDRFFVPDVLTRIPINYLGRIINVELFGFLPLLLTGVSGGSVSTVACGLGYSACILSVTSWGAYGFFL